MQDGMRMWGRGLGLGALLCALLLTSACEIKSNKGANGDDDNVKISTPFGGLKVNSDNVDAASLGLPTYPGAHLVTKKDDGKDDDGSVDMHMGFGQWQMHLQVVSYGTPDAEDKVVAFYKKALTAKFGDVIECAGNSQVSGPVVTSGGLGCSDDGNSKHINVSYDRDLELKAGSKRRQHIVGFKKSSGGETRFSLVNLELPNTDQQKETN